jgi:hypothetical protein
MLRKLFIYSSLIFFILSGYPSYVSAGSNAAGNTLCTYGSSDGCVNLSNNETYTNGGTIQAWRKAVNARNRTGTTFTNNENAMLKISASAALTYGGTVSEAGSSATHTINNSGTIQAAGQTIQMQNAKNFTITNFSTGTIKATSANQRALWGTATWGTSSTDNRGTITATLEGVYASTRSGKTLDYTLTNSGTITSSAGNAVLTKAAATEITNSGTITGAADALDLGGTISTVTNTGTLNGSTVDIDNNGAITTLINDQGGSDTLTYDGAVPSNYNVILNSTSDFGKIDFSNESGSLTFGISDTSTLSANTYASVLQNIAGGNIGNENSYINYNSTYKYRLVANGNNWDLEVANRRTGYKVRITKARFSEIASIFENLNTQGKKSTLTSNLDGLTDAALEKAFKQIKGLTVQKSLGQSIKSNNSFKRAMTSAIKGPSFSQLVQNNFANLNQNDIQSFYNPGVERVNLTNDFTISDIAKVYSKRNLLQIGAPDNSFYLRTFGGVTEQDKVGDDIGYDSNTAGFVFGNQTNIDNLQAGWGVGVSTTGLDYDEGFGLNNTHSLHGNFFANKEYKHLDTNLNLGSFLSKNNSTRNITEGSIQTLKSSTYDLGFDLTGGISKKINLKGWIFNPSIKLDTSYVIQDDIDESGGDLALKVKTDNLLQIKPELGFNLDREFSNNGLVSRGFNFSLFGSEEKKLDGADTTATIKDTGDKYALTDNKKTDRFITTGLGYSSQNSKNNSQFLINAFATQNQHNDMNSSLVSFTYNKKF